MNEPVLAPALRGLLPDARRTLLLRACLLPADEARAAFVQWQSGTDDPRRDLGASVAQGRLLAPLLYRAAQPWLDRVESALLTQLRVASEREAQRSRAYGAILADVLERCARERLTPVALKGAALDPRVYPAPGLRHTHDIDLLFPEAQLPATAAVMRATGFSVANGGLLSRGQGTWVHSSGMPAAMHWKAFIAPLWNDALDPLEGAVVAPPPASPRVPCAEHELIHVCAQAAAGPHRASLVWVTDAFFLLTRGGPVNWPRFVEMAVRGVPVQLYVMLRYLSDVLRAPVPGEALAALGAAADRASRFSGETALHGLLPGRPAIWRDAENGRARWFVARWALFPSRAYVQSRDGSRAAALVPLWYVWRAVRAVARRLRRVLGN